MRELQAPDARARSAGSILLPTDAPEWMDDAESSLKDRPVLDRYTIAAGARHNYLNLNLPFPRTSFHSELAEYTRQPYR